MKMSTNGISYVFLVIVEINTTWEKIMLSGKLKKNAHPNTQIPIDTPQTREIYEYVPIQAYLRQLYS